MTRNITLSAEDEIIERARNRAKAEHKSLNTVFRDWLSRYARGHKNRSEYDSLMRKFDYAQPGRHLSRDEMNER